MKKKEKGFILTSVFNKKGIAGFIKRLNDLSYKIISTEGTGQELAKSGISFIPAQKISRNPEGLDGCIKTISFRIEAAILFDRLSVIHVGEAKKLNIKQIDIVICNFPPIGKVIKKPHDFNIKNIDVGGPLMVRAAATNFRNVLVIVDPNDYQKVADAITEDKVTIQLRQQLAVKAFSYTKSYDNEIIKYLQKHSINSSK